MSKVDFIAPKRTCLLHDPPSVSYADHALAGGIGGRECAIVQRANDGTPLLRS
jgi:hypothetical protein